MENDSLLRSLTFSSVFSSKKAQEQGLAQAEEKDMAKAVRDLKWYPKY